MLGLGNWKFLYVQQIRLQRDNTVEVYIIIISKTNKEKKNIFNVQTYEGSFNAIL